MPRRKNPDGTTPAPKPRVRKKKEPVQPPVENKIESVYDAPMIPPNGLPMMMDDGMYGVPPTDYVYYAAQPTFSSPDPSSPYMNIPPQSSTPQPNAATPNMMMRGMPGPAQQPHGMPSGAPHMTAPSPLEYRLHDVNRRLYIFNNSGINEKDHAQWWDAFAHEFFDDEARMSFTVFDESTQHTERFTVGRQLIPRYFRSIFDSGVREMYYVVRAQSREAQNSYGLITYECDNVLLVTKHDNPTSEVQTECKFVIEFTLFDEIYNHRIRHWNMELRTSQEYVFSEISKEYELSTVEPEKGKSGRSAMAEATLNYLRLCAILEPMQVLMSQSKSNMLTPRDSLKRVLFHQHAKMQQQQQQQQMAMHAQMAAQPSMMPPAVEEPKPKPARKRQRKPAANSKSKKANASPAPTNAAFPPTTMHGTAFPPMGYQEVMVVGEPSMMGGDYGDEDERTISRVENTQFDPNALQMQRGMQNPGGPPMSGPPGSMVPPMGGSMGPPMGGPPMGPPTTMSHMGQPLNGHPQQGQPPSFDYSTQSWQQPPNATMITG